MPTELTGVLGFLVSTMPLDWLKIGLNSVKKIMWLSLRVPLESWEIAAT